MNFIWAMYTSGIRIGRLCYAMCKDGSSKRSFEKEILKADMGDINHSEEFPVLFRPFVVAQISQRLTIYFGTRLEQTSFNPSIYMLTKVRIITELVNSLPLLRSFQIHHTYSLLCIFVNLLCSNMTAKESH